MKFLRWVIRLTFQLFLLGLVLGVGGFVYAYMTYGRDLPSIEFMKAYAPPAITRVHASDGQVIAEYANERRVFVPVESVPEVVKGAFLSAEDKDFYSHGGVDFFSLAGAMVNNFKRWQAGRSLVGASTITQQVAKNFITGDARNVERKAQEAFIAWKLERELSKGEILELYLNEIEFGQRSFGIGAAALTYFNKSLDELTPADAAYLASLPKAPSNYHPVRHKVRALERRNWVLGQMEKNGYLTALETEVARTQDLTVDFTYRTDILRSGYFSDEVKRELDRRFSEVDVKDEGLSVRSTLDPVYQDIAQRALRAGLNEYDRRHGWRGPLGRVATDDVTWEAQLEEIAKTPGLGDWSVAWVFEISGDRATIAFADRTTGYLPLENLTWARPWRPGQKLGPSVRTIRDVLTEGDVIAVSLDDASAATWTLEQIPEAEGALVALDPHTGRVHALVGGYDYARSQFNRATQAKRQPGSTFKPFVYLAALDSGMTPYDKALDSPVVVNLPDGTVYRPQNSDGKFLGAQPLRVGLELSRNLMTLRLAQQVGMDQIVGYADKFDIDHEMQPWLSMALGSGGTSVLQMTAAYGMLVNGGKHITPTLIDRVQDRKGGTLLRSGQQICPSCQDQDWMGGHKMPVFLDKRLQIADPVNVYQVVSMLRGVTARGTAKRIGKTIDRPVGGKTGTTNNNVDAWFIGFTPDLVVGVWVGFNKPQTLGKGEYGGRAAAPIFRDFVNEALNGQPAQAFRVPKGTAFRHIDPITGVIKLEEEGADEPSGTAPVDQIQSVSAQSFDPYAASGQFGGQGTGQGFGQGQFVQSSQPVLIGYDQFGQPVFAPASAVPGAIPAGQGTGFGGSNFSGTGGISVQPIPAPGGQPASGNLSGVY